MQEIERKDKLKYASGWLKHTLKCKSYNFYTNNKTNNNTNNKMKSNAFLKCRFK